LSEILPARLENSIVKGAGIASGTEINLLNSGGSNFFWIAVISVPGKDLKQLENQSLQEIERLARETLSPAEMERFSTGALRSRAVGLVSTNSRASTLEQLFAAGGSSEALNRWEDRERKLTAADLQHAARQYLNPAYRVTMIVQPPAEHAR
jgi:zinc protease